MSVFWHILAYFGVVLQKRPIVYISHLMDVVETVKDVEHVSPVACCEADELLDVIVRIGLAVTAMESALGLNSVHVLANVIVHNNRYLLVLDDKVPRLDLVVRVACNTPLTVRFDRSKELL